MSKITIFENRPSLRDEWDFERNTIDPTQISYGSAKHVHWVCSSGHRWFDRVQRRSGDQICPECRLALEKANHWSTKNPELVALLDNKEDASFSFNNRNIKVNWTCPKGHKQLTTLYTMKLQYELGCKFCKNSQPYLEEGINDVLSQLPDIAHQFTDKKIDPSKILSKSSTVYSWTCDKGHEWETSVRARFHSKTKTRGCPYCATTGRYKRITLGVNDLLSQKPIVASEFQDKSIDPASIFVYSNKSYMWECAQGHVWEARVADRSYNNSGCGTCYRPNANQRAYLFRAENNND